MNHVTLYIALLTANMKTFYSSDVSSFSECGVKSVSDMRLYTVQIYLHPHLSSSIFNIRPGWLSG